MPTAVTPRNFTIYVRIFGTSRTPSPTILFHLKLDKYIKYGTLYKTDNLVFYSLKRKYHLRLSNMLLGFGCEIMQGYYSSKPVPVSEYENMLKNYHFAE